MTLSSERQRMAKDLMSDDEARPIGRSLGGPTLAAAAGCTRAFHDAVVGALRSRKKRESVTRGWRDARLA